MIRIAIEKAGNRTFWRKLIINSQIIPEKAMASLRNEADELNGSK